MTQTIRLDSLSDELAQKWQDLLELFRNYGSAVVAFSGGVDSGLLCVAAWHALKERMLAVTIRSPFGSEDDLLSAQNLAAQFGFPLRIVDFDDLSNAEFVANPANRCYLCKSTHFHLIKEIVKAEGFHALVEGSNTDDTADYRPGFQAVIENGASSPLLDLGFSKDQIRTMAKALGMSNWDRPSAPCLATRFPYGSPITLEGLTQVSRGEDYLRSFGLHNIRVRHHGQIVRIEVAPGDVELLVGHRQQIADFFQSIGFIYVTVDLRGYRLGSLNEVLA